VYFMVEEKRSRKVLDAALAVFVRFGFRKTTMGDIANAAKISRPALYLIFPNKEAAFDAVLRDMGARAMAQIRGEIPSLPDRRARLRCAVEHWCVSGYALASSSPAARDLVEETQQGGRSVMQQIYREFEQIIIDILGPGAGPPPETMASLLSAAAQGFKHSEPTVEEYRQHLFQSIDILLAAHSQE
jgi:AcrR family transcriptional regulator